MLDEKDWTILFLGGGVGIVSSVIASLLVGPVLQTVATYRIIRVLSWLFSRFQSDIFQEPWQQIWEVRSSHFARSNISQITFRRFAQFIVADTSNSTLDGKTIYWRLVGRISRESYVTGTWYDLYYSAYHGAFQMSLSPLWNTATGTWIGFSTNGTVKSGRLTWVRKGAPVPPPATQTDPDEDDNERVS